MGKAWGSASELARIRFGDLGDDKKDFAANLVVGASLCSRFLGRTWAEVEHVAECLAKDPHRIDDVNALIPGAALASEWAAVIAGI